jgi:hypothetical protein
MVFQGNQQPVSRYCWHAPVHRGGQRET